MKKSFKAAAGLILVLALLAGLSACSGGASAPVEAKTLSAKVIEVYNGTMLLADESGGLYITPFVGENLELVGEELEAGKEVEISYSGDIAESFPMELNGVTRISVADSASGDLVGLYSLVIGDLWRDGEDLRGDIEVVALGLSQCENLNEGEKQALLYLVQNRYHFETLAGDIDELREQGYIDKEQLFFPKGVLISFSNTAFESDGFTFDATIWRSGLAAIIFTDCAATRAGGEWSYSVGGWGIA